MARAINQAGRSLIESFESCVLAPYQDVRGIWSIGYGHTKGVTENSPPITQAQADVLLESDLIGAENLVSKFIRTSLTDNQFAALVSLTYNAGYPPLAGTIGRLLNSVTSPDYQGAADAFLLWNKAHIDGVLQEVGGLTRRRMAERALFLTN